MAYYDPINVVPFSKKNPERWFSDLEAQFVRANISEERIKASYVIQVIDDSIVLEVSDILRDQSATNMFSRLKDRLIQVYGLSDEQRFRILFTEIQLGNKTPSQLLWEMRDLAQGKLSDLVLKVLWTQRLPPLTQAILVTKTGELDELAAIADRISNAASASWTR